MKGKIQMTYEHVNLASTCFILFNPSVYCLRSVLIVHLDVNNIL